MTSNDTAIVLFSGGQDSTTCLAWALSRFARVHTIGFEYGQRHRVEIDCRAAVLDGLRALNADWAAKLGEDHLLALPALGQIADTSLTRERAIAYREDGLPDTFVPGRNLLFFTYAAALADRLGATALVGGMCETDFSGYPDCRRDTLDALEASLRLGLNRPNICIETPLMALDKAASWRLARELGGEELVALIREQTHSCYLGERGVLHEWGHGCGGCPACKLRAKGWREYTSA